MDEKATRNLSAVPDRGDEAAPETAAILTPEAFHRALHREWARGQRIGHPLALILIAPPTNARDGQALKALAQALCGRLRCTDLVGWREGGQLGLLLPHTSGRAAWELVDSLRARLSESPAETAAETAASPLLPEGLAITVYAQPAED